MRGVWIGTSGWSYKGWASAFYPADWPKSDHLGFYATQFPTVEINATFYRLPTIQAVENWRRKAPAGFVFAVKGSRYITHIKRMKGAKQGLEKYFERIEHLAERLGPILWQLPPTLKKDPDQLKAFLRELPAHRQHAIEFRHPSWIDEQTFALLHNYKAALVWISSRAMPVNFTVTADFVYLRFHGLEHGAAHDYTRAELDPWASQLRKCARAGKPAFVYFNNDWNARAPANARTLMEMSGKHAVQQKTE
jgi:uncharacterized protein YecE (DUF72 family)